MFKKVFGLMALALATLAPVANAQTAADGTTDSKVTYSEYEFAEEPQAPKVSHFSAGLNIGLADGVGFHGSDENNNPIYGGVKVSAAAQLDMSKWLRLAPEVGGIFTKNKNYWNFDVNFHEVWHLNETLEIAKPVINVYTMTGIGMQLWEADKDNFVDEALKGENKGTSKTFKLNFGAGADVTICDHIKLVAEWQYGVAILGYSSSSYTLGVQYAF